MFIRQVKMLARYLVVTPNVLAQKFLASLVVGRRRVVQPPLIARDSWLSDVGVFLHPYSS